MSRDQKFFDMYSLVIGVLALVALAIFVFAAKMSDMTADVYTKGGDEYQAEVIASIKPVGEVWLPGEEQAADEPVVEAVAEPEPVAAAKSGPQIYNEACLVCHGAGIGGAPVLGDAAQWTDRIAQGVDVLKQHAIDGYTGSAGYMPPKGGRMDLSDDEVGSAVDYMIEEAQ